MNHHIQLARPVRDRGLRRTAALLAALLLALPAVGLAADGTTRMSGVVNLNTADVEQLQLLPGVGEKRAAAIIEVRKSKGGFKSVDELLEVKGVGQAMLDRLRPHLSVSGKTTAKRLGRFALCARSGVGCRGELGTPLCISVATIARP